MNFLRKCRVGDDGRTSHRARTASHRGAARRASPSARPRGPNVTFGLRPEHVRPAPWREHRRRPARVVELVEPLGSETLVLVRLGAGGSELTGRFPPEVRPRPGRNAYLSASRSAAATCSIRLPGARSARPA